MTIQSLMESKNLTRYRLSKNSGIPYTTITDIISGKAKLEKCTAETIYKLSKELDVTMGSLLEACFETKSSFELYKSDIGFDDFAKIQIFLYKNANFPVADCNVCQNIVQ